MKKLVEVAKDLREELAAIAVSKSATKASSRRYTDKEIELILSAAKQYGVVAKSALTGVSNWTI